MKFVYFATLTALLLSASMLAPVYNASSQALSDRAFRSQSSFDSTPVTVAFGDVIYEIPRNYLAGIHQPTDRKANASFTIKVVLPDFAPRTPATAEALDKAGWHDQLTALVQYQFEPRLAEDVLKFYLQISRTAESDFTVIGGKYRLYRRPTNVPHEIYTIETPHGLLLFTCAEKGDFSLVVYPSCTVIERLGDKFGVIYHFGRDYLFEVADIDEKLRGLLKSFVKR